MSSVQQRWLMPPRASRQMSAPVAESVTWKAQASPVQSLPHAHGAPAEVGSFGAAHGCAGSCPAAGSSMDVPVVRGTFSASVATGEPSGGHALETGYDSPRTAPGKKVPSTSHAPPSFAPP